MTEKAPLTVHEAIRAVSASVGSIAKDGWNAHQKYKFRGIDQLMDAVQPALVEHGVTIVPRVVQYNFENRPTDKAIQRWCTVLVEYTVTGPAGDSIVSTMVGEAADHADKAMNKAMTSAAKYFMFQTFWFGIEGGMDEHDSDDPRGGPVKNESTGRAPQQTRNSRSVQGTASTPPADGDVSSSDQQRDAIKRMAGRLKWDEATLISEIQAITSDTDIAIVADLSKIQAAEVISSLNDALRKPTSTETQEAPPLDDAPF